MKGDSLIISDVNYIQPALTLDYVESIIKVIEREKPILKLDGYPQPAAVLDEVGVPELRLATWDDGLTIWDDGLTHWI